VDDDVVLGRLGLLDGDDGVGAVRHGRTGRDPDGRAGRDLDLDHPAGHLVADHLPPGRAVGGHHGKAVHRRGREGWVILRRHQILGQDAPDRLRDRHPLDVERSCVAENGRSRLVRRAHPVELCVGKDGGRVRVAGLVQRLTPTGTGRPVLAQLYTPRPVPARRPGVSMSHISTFFRRTFLALDSIGAIR
jgi:hypothetical protein